MLELVDRSKVKPKGVLDEEALILDSWEYPVDFFILHPKSTSGGHLVALGRPWPVIAYAFIGCRLGDMFLSRRNLVKQVSLYPPAKSITEVQDFTWFDKGPSDGDISQLIFTIDQTGSLKQPSKEYQIARFLCDAETIHHDDSTNRDLEQIFEMDVQENSDPTTLLSLSLHATNISLHPKATLVEISQGKYLHINPELEGKQAEKLIDLQKQSKAFAWHYNDMKGIHPDTCSRHIFTQEGAIPVRQPQRQMNPALKDIVKEELQKMLNVNFIYLISDNKWVSPLVVVPKKNGKW